MSWTPLKPNGSNYSGLPTESGFSSYGVAETIRLLNNIDKKLYVIIKKLELLGQPETDEVLNDSSSSGD